ncbi:N-glycosylase/DNA lyase [Candidatus Woesearchaeota archaeon]|nr:N-glycosylase/DNA lyase [Candidatus Woesearchaeota archaeon]
MEAILSELESLKGSSVSKAVSSRMKEFEAFRKADDDTLFSELAFCLMTANFQAEKSMKIQEALGKQLISSSEERLARELKMHGHRFPNMRAAFIVEARKHRRGLRAKLDSFDDSHARRNWLVANVKGLGMKEASHFLRNVGYKGYAIIDFHIIDKLASAGLVDKPVSKSLTPKQYLEIEEVLKRLGERSNLSQAELDLYLWFAETGKVLK